MDGSESDARTHVLVADPDRATARRRAEWLRPDACVRAVATATAATDESVPVDVAVVSIALFDDPTLAVAGVRGRDPSRSVVLLTDGDAPDAPLTWQLSPSVDRSALRATVERAARHRRYDRAVRRYFARVRTRGRAPSGVPAAVTEAVADFDDADYETAYRSFDIDGGAQHG